MRGLTLRKGVGWAVLCAAFLLGGFKVFAITPTTGHSPQKLAHEKAFKVYREKCLGCHDSVADPEKPGMSRHDWTLVVNVMHGYGLFMTALEREMVVDLLHNLRKAPEK